MNTKSLIFIILALFALNSPTTAQQDSLESSNPVLNSYEEWRAQHGEEWRLRRHIDLPTAQFLWGYNLPNYNNSGDEKLAFSEEEELRMTELEESDYYANIYTKYQLWHMR